MTAYGRAGEPANVRDFPDVADIGYLGLPSRHGKQRSASRRATRRGWAKRARRAAIIAIAAEVASDCSGAGR